MADVYAFEAPFASAFYDFDEDVSGPSPLSNLYKGTNDMLVMGRDKDGSLGIHGAFNNLNNDAYFFKTLGTRYSTYKLNPIGLNGICTQWCSEGATIPDPKPYGVNQYGAAMKFTFSSMTGVVRAAAVPQLPQTAYSPLITPYTLAGLGRPANYIDYFFLGTGYCETF